MAPVENLITLRTMACESTSENRPALLLMTGDQVYVDDVAGPMLHAIHHLDVRLGLFDEVISGAVVDRGSALVQHEVTYYRHTRLLPRTRINASLIERFFGGARRPVFTTANAQKSLPNSQAICLCCCPDDGLELQAPVNLRAQIDIGGETRMFEVLIRFPGSCILLQLTLILDVFRVQTNGIGVLPNQEMP